jgi:hypothetical protein
MDYCKLFVKKLPLLLTKEEKESLLKCFGAYRVDVFPLSGKMVGFYRYIPVATYEI